MASPIEHKFTRSGGVYGLRSTGRSLEINEETLIITEYVGVSVDDDDIWKITQIDGVSTLVNQRLGAGADYYVATRVKDETLGYILAVDFDGPTVKINPDRILQTESDVVVYGDSPLTAGTGSRLLLEDGRSLVVVDVAVPA
jgi:hypothetical protein